MRTYMDAGKQSREVSVTVRSIRRVMRETGWNLANIATEMVAEVPLIGALRMDPDVLAKVLYALLPPEGRPSEDDFAEKLDGRTLKEAWDALYEELVDFFRNLGRSDLVEALKAAPPMVEAAMAEAVARIREELTPPGLPGSGSTSSPASAA